MNKMILSKIWSLKEEFLGSEEEFLSIDRFYSKHWELDGVFHRENGPARIFSSGQKEWFQNGKRHRVDGPAMIRPDGYRAWYENGVFIKKMYMEPLRTTCDLSEDM